MRQVRPRRSSLPEDTLTLRHRGIVLSRCLPVGIRVIRLCTRLFLVAVCLLLTGAAVAAEPNMRDRVFCDYESKGSFPRTATRSLIGMQCAA